MSHITVYNSMSSNIFSSRHSQPGRPDASADKK
jgi:hypothetical protein